MSKLIVRPSVVEDCAELAVTMRDADRREIALAGSSGPYDSLMRGFVNSDAPMSIVSPDGAVVGMAGVVALSPILGSPWMLGADGMLTHKWQFLRECRDHLQVIHQAYPYLHNEVWEGNVQHIRWLQWLGFRVSPTSAHRPHFRPFWKANV